MFSRPALVLLVYYAAWTLLNAASTVFQVAPPNVAVWYPPAALSFVLLFVFGLRYTPALLLHPLLDYLFVSSNAITSVGFEHYVVYGLAETLLYGGAAALLLRPLRIDPRLATLRDVLWFVLVAALAAPLALAAIQAANFAWADSYRWEVYGRYLLFFWAGNATGIAAFAPLLLVLLRTAPGIWHDRPDALLEAPGRPHSREALLEALAQAVAAVGAAYLAFGLSASPTLDHTYVLAFPVLWAAARHGFARATFIVLLLNVSVAFVVGGAASRFNGVALQFGLMSTTLVGVVLGAFITDRHRRSEALVHAKQQAERAAQVKDTLLMNMSHEIRTPLTSILGFAEMLADATSGTQQAYAQAVHRQGGRLLHTLQNVLEYARLDLGADLLHPRPLDVLETAGAVARDFQEQADARGLLLQATLVTLDREAYLDPAAFRSLLVQLLDNAVKYTEQGHVVVEVGVSGGRVRLCVRDTGIGIAASRLPRVFEPFRQASEGLTRTYEGTGLGLAIVERTVALMDGAIEVESRPGQGSTFTVHLPCRRVPAAVPPRSHR